VGPTGWTIFIAPFSARVGKPLDGGVRQLSPSILLADENANFQVLWEDGGRIFCRVGSHYNADGSVLPAVEHPTPVTLDRLPHEYGLWASANVPRGAIFGFTTSAHPVAASCSKPASGR
jgi:hypothetical protein